MTRQQQITNAVKQSPTDDQVTLVSQLLIQSYTTEIHNLKRMVKVKSDACEVALTQSNRLMKREKVWKMACGILAGLVVFLAGVMVISGTELRFVVPSTMAFFAGGFLGVANAERILAKLDRVRRETEFEDLS